MKIHLKHSAEPFIAIGAGTAGAIIGNQFLDFEKLMPASDHTGFMFVHQGGIKAAAAGLSIGMFGKKMPAWAKYAIIGVGIAGAIKEAKVLSSGQIVAIGSENSTGSDTSQLDRLLEEAAKKSMSGMGANDPGAGVGMGANDPGAGVGNLNPMIPNMDYGSTVGYY